MAIKVRQTYGLSFLPFLSDILHVMHHSPGGKKPQRPPLKLFPDILLGLLRVDFVAGSLRV